MALMSISGEKVTITFRSHSLSNSISLTSLESSKFPTARNSPEPHDTTSVTEGAPRIHLRAQKHITSRNESTRATQSEQTRERKEDNRILAE